MANKYRHIISTLFFTLGLFWIGDAMSDNDKYNYKSESQQVEDEIWDSVDAYEQNPNNQNELLDTLEASLSKLQSKQQKDALYVDILKSLGKQLSIDSVMNLYSKISDDRKLISPLNKILLSRENNEKKQIQDYVLSKLNKISDSPLKHQLLLDVSRILAKNKVSEVNMLLSSIHQSLRDNIDKEWGLDGSLKLAGIYHSIENIEKSIFILDSLLSDVLKVEKESRKIILISKICEIYVSNKSSDKALSLLKKASSGDLDLSSRRLSQRVLKEHNDYKTAAEFISLIESPVQRFLGFETWLSKASRENDDQRMQQAITEINKVIPNLSKPTDKFNAYIALTHAHQTLENDNSAKQSLKMADSLLEFIPKHMQKDSHMRVQLLKN